MNGGLNMKKSFTLAKVFSTNFSDNRKHAFTLAEVLITLGIIGVVAALTLPALIQNHRNKELQTGLKKGYSILSQALELYQAQNGERIKEGNVGHRKLKNLIMPYFKTVKDCAYGTELSSCIPNNSYIDEDKQKPSVYKTFNGKTSLWMDQFDDGQFIIADGMLVLIENTDRRPNLYISIDVNGYGKKPNRLGQDLFMFQIDSKGALRPMGMENTQFHTNEFCSKTSYDVRNGAGCTYKALTETDYFKNLPK